MTETSKTRWEGAPVERKFFREDLGLGGSLTLPVQSDFPAAAIMVLEELVGFGAVRGFDPFAVMADGVLDERLRLHEALEIFFRHENVPAIVGEQHPFLADEEH